MTRRAEVYRIGPLWNHPTYGPRWVVDMGYDYTRHATWRDAMDAALAATGQSTDEKEKP